GFFIIRGETMSRRKNIAQVGDLITAVEADGSHSVWIIEKIRTFYLDIGKDGIVKSLPITDFSNLVTADKIIKYKSYYRRKPKPPVKEGDLIKASLDGDAREFVVSRVGKHYIYVMDDKDERYRFKRGNL
ncbi:MAG: hypothetical protein ACKPGB_30945, partial [Dolichospermum sp.]